MICEHRNIKRYEDYADKGRSYGPNVDYADGLIRSQMYSKEPTQNEEIALPTGPEMEGDNVSRIPTGLKKGQMFHGG